MECFLCAASPTGDSEEPWSYSWGWCMLVINSIVTSYLIRSSSRGLLSRPMFPKARSLLTVNISVGPQDWLGQDRRVGPIAAALQCKHNAQWVVVALQRHNAGPGRYRLGQRSVMLTLSKHCLMYSRAIITFSVNDCSTSSHQARCTVGVEHWKEWCLQKKGCTEKVHTRKLQRQVLNYLLSERVRPRPAPPQLATKMSRIHKSNFCAKCAPPFNYLACISLFFFIASL